MFVFSNLFKVMEIYEIYTKTEKKLFMQYSCAFRNYLCLAECITAEECYASALFM